MAAARLAGRCAWPAAGATWAGLLALAPASDVARRDSPAEAAESHGADVTTRAQRRALRRDRFVVVDGALNATEAAAAHAACEGRRGSFQKTPQDDPAARTDRVTWIGGDDASPALRVAIERLRGVANELDRDAAGGGAWQGFDGDNASRGSRRSRALGVPVSGQLARYQRPRRSLAFLGRPVCAEYPRPGRGGAATRDQTPASAEYPRPGRGGAAIRLNIETPAGTARRVRATRRTATARRWRAAAGRRSSRPWPTRRRCRLGRAR